MAARSKKIAVEGDVFDVIRSLPSNVVTHILDFLPVDDLARTSVLSRNWRYIWASHPNININYYSLEINKRKNWSAIVSKILLQHIGPVLKFSLVMDPPDDSDYSFVAPWLLYLSKNGIKELTLCFKTQLGEPREDLTLPSHIHSAPELIVLNLKNIIFKPPNGHAYFRKLTILNFSEIDFGLYKLKYAVNTPQLTHLTFIYCSGICHFKICAPKLKTLTIEESAGVELNGFETPEITTLDLMECDFKKMSLTELFEKWRQISYFYVNEMTFKFLVADTTHLEGLPINAGCLRHLVIVDMDFSDLHVISCMLYLLKSSTALSRLEISVVDSTRCCMTNGLIEVLQYLDAPHNMNWMTNSLEVVVIDGINNPEIELCIIKFLLSRAPKLKKMFVASRGREREIIKLARHLLRFPRASKEAEIIFERDVRVARIPEVYSLS